MPDRRRRLRFVLGDQLSQDISCLNGLDPARDIVLMVEVSQEARTPRHHKQKIAFLLSAMRHFAQSLRAARAVVDYVQLDDPANTQSFGSELARALARLKPDVVVMTEPGEYRIQAMIEQWREEFDTPLVVLPDHRFFCSRDEFASWARGKRQLRMEFFYREMRRATGLLMEAGQPVGKRWNFDPENRKRIPRDVTAPAPRRFPPDAITRAVIDLVRDRFADHFGDLDTFGWAVTREAALEALDAFIQLALPRFGDYQDAMRRDDDFLFHSALSPYLNCGLLGPCEVCAAAEEAWRRGVAPLNAVEGFIRQILGWREFVRGVYWSRMPDYAAGNHLEAKRPLPWFFWSGDTSLACMADCIRSTRTHAYAHHIQRLMVLGNFALLAGLAPEQVEAWYLIVYVDAYEWVELPNVHGMALFADGGAFASKPYAASGAYIARMSDYCGTCAFDPDVKVGPGACPFNLLYWDFLIRNEQRLAGNPRLSMPYRALADMPAGRRAAIARQAAAFLDGPDCAPEAPET